jgi:hypothetical protein
MPWKKVYALWPSVFSWQSEGGGLERHADPLTDAGINGLRTIAPTTHQQANQKRWAIR